MTAGSIDEGVQFLSRHLVGLCVTYRHKTQEDAGLPSRFTTCSGTLIIVEGILYFLTAGHVLKSLSELRGCGDVLIEGAALADIFGYRRISDTPIPFDLKNSKLWFIDDEELGLDFGVIPLGPHYARLLLKNGMVALCEENWTTQHRANFEGFAMLGFPAERVSERVSDSSTVKIEATLIPVQRLATLQDDRKTKYPRFVGRVSPGVPLKSLEGMSGGIILGFQEKPQLTYCVVAIQSSWNPPARIIYGCGLPVLASLMTHWAKTNLAVLKELDSNTALMCPTPPHGLISAEPHHAV